MRDEVVVNTGASAGLGRATARECGRHSAKVGLIARGIEGLEAAKCEIESAGGRAMVLPLDVADANAVENAAAAIEDEFGPIDIWVNTAMASVFSPVKEMKADEYKRVTEVTYLGVVYGTLGVGSTLSQRKQTARATKHPRFREDRKWHEQKEWSRRPVQPEVFRRR